MEETFSWILRIMAFIGIGIFLWSAAESLGQIAKAFTRMADAAERFAPKPPTGAV